MKPVDPLKNFEQPTRLHRKDPKNLQFQMSMKELEEKKKDDVKKEEQRIQRREEYMKRKGIKQEAMSNEQIDEGIELETMNEEERNKHLELKKRQEEEEKREKEREERMKLVAPDGGARKKKQVIKRKTRQIRAYDENKRKLRYEEFYPWVMEDYDARQAWVGNYEAGVTDNYCLLVLDNKEKCFRLLPLEKYYQFTPRNKYATLTLEEAEAKMSKGNTGQRWLMRKMAQEAASGERVDLRYRKFQTTNDREETDEGGGKSDDDDMDFDDEFQDDEEAPIIQGNEAENKLVEGKMKKNMLKANNLIERTEQEEEDSDLDDLFETRKVDKEGKKLRKVLAQSAMNEVYDTDDEDNNPYLSDSDVEKDDSDDDEDKIITIKREPGVDGELEEEVTVKAEDEDGTQTLSTTTKHEKRKIFTTGFKNGFVTIKAPKSILSQFPAGQWNPETAIKRKASSENGQPPLKKIKLKLGHGNSKSVTHDNSGPYEIKRADVDELVKDGPILLTTLVRSLKNKMSRDPNARKNLKRVLKGHFILKNKKVYARNN